MESCNRFSGVENAAYLHYVKNASVYVGPGCNNGKSLLQHQHHSQIYLPFAEMLVIGRLVSRWNVPIIAHMSGDDVIIIIYQINMCISS